MTKDRTAPAILVVEDDADLRDAFRAALTVAGYAVVAVEDGLDALRRIDAAVPDAIVLDLVLPRLHGLDVHRELQARADTREVPIIVVTGDLGGADPAGFACVLRKPFDIDALVRAVEDCLRHQAGGTGRHPHD